MKKAKDEAEEYKEVLGEGEPVEGNAEGEVTGRLMKG